MAFKIENKIIDIDSPESVKFSEFLNGIFDKLKMVEPDILKNIDKVKFGIFSNEKGLNATANPKYNPPVIGFTKDLINSVNSVDEMSAVLAHELSHLVFFSEKRKTSKLINDINEERFCDIIAFKMLESAGYNPQSFIDFFEKVRSSENSQPFNGVDISYSKDHPNSLERIRNIEDLLAVSEMSGKEYQEKILINEDERKVWGASPYFESHDAIPYHEAFALERINIEDEKSFMASENKKDDDKITSEIVNSKIDLSLLEDGNVDEFLKRYAGDFAFNINNKKNKEWQNITSSFHNELKEKYHENPDKYGEVIRNLYLDENFKDFGNSFKSHYFLNNLLEYKDLFNKDEREKLLFSTKILFNISEIDYKDMGAVKNFFEFAGIDVNDYQQLGEKFSSNPLIKQRNIHHLNTMLLSLSVYENEGFNLDETISSMQKDTDKQISSPYPVVEYLKKNYHEIVEKNDLNELVKIYTALHNLPINDLNKEVSVNVFDYDRKACDAFEKVILKKFRKEKDYLKIKEVSETLLKEALISSPSFRRIMRQKFVSSSFALIGLDDGTKEFSERFLSMSKDILENFKMGEGIKALSQLSRLSGIQKETAFMVNEKVKNHLILNDGINNLPLTKTITFIFDNIEKNKDGQIALLDFLTSPLHNNNLNTAFNKIYPSFEYHAKNVLKEDLPNFFDINDDKNVFKNKMAMMHENFWNLPKNARSVLLSRIIFPVNGEKDDTEVKDFLSKKIFKEGSLIEKNIADLFETYEKQCSPYLRRLVFSGIVASISPYETKNQGKVLNEIFSYNGPAGTKVLQAIGSYDKSLPDIRKEANKAKSELNLPHMWEIWQDISERLPKETQDNLKFKQILGAGAYAYTVEMIDKNGKSYALSLLRKDAETRAKSEFQRMSSAMSELSKSNDYFKEILPLINDAKQSVLQECDFEISSKQAEFAGKHHYTGQKYQIDGFEFTVKNADILAFGHDYKIAEKAKGSHLNDMNPSTPYTKAAAKAIFTAEFEQILKGTAIDDDRHGAQMKIDQDGNITMFDNSALNFDTEAMEVKNPSEEQIKAVAKLVKRAVINSVVHKTDMQLSLIKELSSSSYDKETCAYATTIKRALLALKDAKMMMGESQEERNNAFKLCVINALNARTTHPIIKSEFMALKTAHKIKESFNTLKTRMSAKVAKSLR